MNKLKFESISEDQVPDRKFLSEICVIEDNFNTIIRYYVLDVAYVKDGIRQNRGTIYQHVQAYLTDRWYIGVKL